MINTFIKTKITGSSQLPDCTRRSIRRATSSLSGAECVLSRPCQISGKLIERAAPGRLHADVGAVERFLLHFGGVVRRPADVEPGLAAGLVFELDHDPRFPRPSRQIGCRVISPAWLENELMNTIRSGET